MHTFQHRYCPGYSAPLKPGKYKFINDWYEVDRLQRVGETCTAYIKSAKQTGNLTKTTYETFEVEK